MKPRTLIKKAMEQRGWDVNQLAKESGIHRTLVYKYIEGKVAVGMKNAPRLARALGLEPGDVLFGSAA